MTTCYPPLLSTFGCLIWIEHGSIIFHMRTRRYSEPKICAMFWLQADIGTTGLIKDIINANKERTHANHENHKPPLNIGSLLSVHRFLQKRNSDYLIPTRIDLEFAYWSCRNHRERLPALVPHQFRRYSRCHPVQLVSLDRTKRFCSIPSTVTEQDTHSLVSKLSRDMSKVRNRHRTVIIHARPFDRAAKRVVGRWGFLVWGHLLARILVHPRTVITMN